MKCKYCDDWMYDVKTHHRCPSCNAAVYCTNPWVAGRMFTVKPNQVKTMTTEGSGELVIKTGDTLEYKGCRTLDYKTIRGPMIVRLFEISGVPCKCLGLYLEDIFEPNDHVHYFWTPKQR